MSENGWITLRMYPYIFLGIFVLQPTHTPREKEKGLKYHAIIQITGITLGILGVIAGILYNLTLTVKSTILRLVV
jgi:hypothetical protein